MAEFFQDPITVTIRDRDILIKPVKVKHLSKAAKLVAPIAADVAKDGLSVAAFIEYPDQIIELVALVCDLPVDWVGELDLEEMLRILAPLIQVNMDFFVRRMVPAITDLTRNLSPVGQASLPS